MPRATRSQNELSNLPANDSLRVAMISYGLPVPGARCGGIERVAHELADGLARRGHTIIVWSYDPAPPGALYRVRPLPYRSFVTSWLGRRLTMGYFGNILALLLDPRNFDAVIAHGDSLLLPLRQLPVIRVMHGIALGEALSARSPWRFLMQIGVYVQELLTGFTQSGCVGVSRNTCRYNPFVRQIILHGVNGAVFHPEPFGKTKHPSIVFVGSLTGRKRGSVLVEWFQRDVLPQHAEATLDVVGAVGPSRQNVRYHVGLSDEELAAVYRRSWLYASPSTYEGFGLPYLEAMACGTPVVASPNPGSEEVLDNGAYGQVVSDDVFPATLNRMLADAELRRSWTERGLQRARALSMDVMIDHYENWIRRLSDAPGRRARGYMHEYDRGWSRPTVMLTGFVLVQYLAAGLLFLPGAQVVRPLIRASLPLGAGIVSVIGRMVSSHSLPVSRSRLADRLVGDPGIRIHTAEHEPDLRHRPDRLSAQHRCSFFLDGPPALRPASFGSAARPCGSTQWCFRTPRNWPGLLSRTVTASGVQ